jgi:hypothetical protein
MGKRRFKQTPDVPKAADNKEKNTFNVFDYQDAKDKESEPLDAQFYRLGFKQVDD